MARVVVVGGGLAGLSTAALLIKRGYEVALLEKMFRFGGRCASMEKDGFRLNYGAHAVYGRDRSYLQKVLAELDIHLSFAGMDPQKVRYALDDQHWTIPPVNANGLFRTRMLPGLRDKLDFLRALYVVSTEDPDSFADQTLEQWLNTRYWRPNVKHMLSHLARTNFFTKEPESLNAARFLRYYRRIFRSPHPVSYIRGGWGRLVEQLENYLRSRGATLRTTASVNKVLFDDYRITGVVAGKETFLADMFIFCAPPIAMKRLFAGTHIEESIEQLATQTPNKVIAYDVALNSRLRSDISYIHDLNEGMFITDPSNSDPSCAPPGGQLLQAIAYLSPDEAYDQDAMNATVNRLERMVDVYYPGWRDSLAFSRVTEQAVVQAVSMSSENKRMPLHYAELTNCYFAGDWCDGDGSVSDVAMSSALEVVAMIQEEIPATRVQVG